MSKSGESSNRASSIDADFHELVNNKELLSNVLETYLNHLIDQVTLGICFETHRIKKKVMIDLNDVTTSPTQGSCDSEEVTASPSQESSDSQEVTTSPTPESSDSQEVTTSPIPESSDSQEDIFKKYYKNKKFYCICPKCEKKIGASRLAPHLHACMGMGRSNSRYSSRHAKDTKGFAAPGLSGLSNNNQASGKKKPKQKLKTQKQ